MFVSKLFALMGLLMATIGNVAMAILSEPQWNSIKYSTVVGFFAQDLAETDDSTFDYISSNFGLLDEFKLQSQSLKAKTEGGDDHHHQNDRSCPPWHKFQKSIKDLNSHAPKNVQYKVLYLARHGQGFHNIAESFYGTPLWNCYWSLLDGNGTISWDDALLTPTGIAEAEKASNAWKTQITYGVPLPEAYYSSPLRRAASTLLITWQNLTLNKENPPKPIVKEKLRETIGIHTCDRRSRRSILQNLYPTFQFPPLDQFPENDPLWDSRFREPNDARNFRLKRALDEIFTSEGGTSSDYVSITAHSGAITSILQVIGHRPFQLQTGGVIPVVVRVEYSPEEEKTPVFSPPQPAPTCTVNATPEPRVAPRARELRV